MLLKQNKAQSTLEYVLVLTALVAVILWGAAQLVKPKVQQAFDDTAKSIENTATQIAP